MVVDHRGQEVVGRGDGVHVAGEVKVDVLHRHHLGVAAAGGAALHPEHRPERRLAQADHGLLPDVVERVAEAHGGRGLAFARRGRRDRGHQDELPVLAALQAADEVQRHLRLVMAVGLEVLLRDAEPRGDFGDAQHLRLLRDFDVRQ